MTKKQKQLVLTWIFSLLIIFIMLLFDDWIESHWDEIRWPLIIIAIIISILSSKKPTLNEGSANLNRIVSQNPWIKIYLLIYCILVAIGSNYVISNDIKIYKNVGFLELSLAIGLIVLPIFVIKAKEAYIAAGEKN